MRPLVGAVKVELGQRHPLLFVRARRDDACGRWGSHDLRPHPGQQVLLQEVIEHEIGDLAAQPVAAVEPGLRGVEDGAHRLEAVALHEFPQVRAVLAERREEVDEAREELGQLLVQEGGEHGLHRPRGQLVAVEVAEGGGEGGGVVLDRGAEDEGGGALDVRGGDVGAEEVEELENHFGVLRDLEAPVDVVREIFERVQRGEEDGRLRGRGCGEFGFALGEGGAVA